MRWLFIIMLAAAALVVASGDQSAGLVLPAEDFTQPAVVARLQALVPELRRMANDTPGWVAITVADAQGRVPISINGDDNLPAASVIKLPVMVEVMRQVSLGRFTLDR